MESFEVFNRDVQTHGGYLYTSAARWSSKVANQRLTDAVIELVDLRGCRLLDVGCGDGTYTVALWDRGAPESAYAFDPADEAVEAARRNAGERPIRFGVHDAGDVPLPDDTFDYAILRGVLHHAENPQAMLREGFRLARNLVVLEPNGYNPALKVIERVSPYHRRHGERSFAPRTLERWMRELDGRILRKSYVGLVPFFCPKPLAKALKLVEPAVEQTPGIRVVACGVCVMLVGRHG